MPAPINRCTTSDLLWCHAIPNLPNYRLKSMSYRFEVFNFSLTLHGAGGHGAADMLVGDET